MRVVVAMSGGVDSSVAAALLRESGCEVIGIGLRLVDGGRPVGALRACCGLEAMDDARRVAEALSIPFYVLDFTGVFGSRVIDYFARSYLAGETPNPCVVCNEVVKYGSLLGVAKGLGAVALATGHYARVEGGPGGRTSLLRSSAPEKDQSYFLWSLGQRQLEAALFPLGEMSKDETREAARCFGLRVHDKPESQDTCFAGKGGYASLVLERAAEPPVPGPILDEKGNTVGSHRGLIHYTVGQRKGLGLSSPRVARVIDIDPVANVITVTLGGVMPATRRLLLRDVNYVSIDPQREPFTADAVTRHRGEPYRALVVPLAGGRAAVEFSRPHELVAPGQSVVFYEDDTVLGGGVATRHLSEEMPPV